MRFRPDYRGGPITEDWFKPWLIQRLERPIEFPEGHPLKYKDNPFAFGGGFRNGGFNKETMDLFRPIFRFDYMGSAEFEFGAVPKAVQSMMATISEITTSSFEIDLGDVDFREWDKKYFNKPTRGQKKSVYVIAKKSHHEDAHRYIRSLLKSPPPDLKEDSRFRNGLLEPKDPKESWLKGVEGWFDIDNCLFFFTDKKMFDGVWGLFAEEPKEKVS